MINLEATSHGVAEIAEFGFVDPTDKNILPTILQTPEFIEALNHEKPVIFYTQLDT